ncbi:unnamed protein product [Rotaria socialis]|uniref:OTU domain-containing protein n=3 Tax=Rotaria socialis TaxID=392032 RepID=A0A820QNQ9_9BILA|nr:unnamed protein product [Rotaria socialis]
MTFESITVTVDQLLFSANNRYFLRGLTLDIDVGNLPKQIPLNRIVSLTLHESFCIKVIENCLELRSLKLIGVIKWVSCTINSISRANTKLNQITVVTPTIRSLTELFTSILSITSLRRLEILTDEVAESFKFCILPAPLSKIEQFLLDSGSTINWNDLSQILPDLSSIRFLSVNLIDRNQKLIPSFIFQNLRTLSLGLLEVSFNWIIQLVATTPCLIKLKLTGLVDADDFVVNQRWIHLSESTPRLLRIFVNVSLEQSKELYHCEKIQAPLCALNLNLVCNGDDNDCNLYYGELEWLLTPINFTNITHFDPRVHKIDQKAKLYLRKAPLNVQNMVPIEVMADGNCLYNSIICLSGNAFLTHSELRVRTILELIKNEVFYNNSYSHIVGPLNEGIKNITHNFSFSELYELVGLKNVLKCNIRSIYPNIDYRQDLNIMNSTFEYAQFNLPSNTIFIFWTHTLNEIGARNNNAGNWTPNHFVPLILPSNNPEFQTNLSHPQVLSSDTTPTKSTRKNSIATQVRIPNFNMEDGEQQLFLTSPMISQPAEEISTTPRTKRRQYSIENNSNADTTNVENQRTLARERMSINRAQAIPEEVERQRVLARQRSATRRASFTSQEIEQQRALSRERNSTIRTSLTPEEAAQQRILASMRTMATRATASPKIGK